MDDWRSVLKSDIEKAPFFGRKPLDMQATQEQNKEQQYRKEEKAFQRLMNDKKLFKLFRNELEKQLKNTPNLPNYVVDTSTLPNFDNQYAPMFEMVFKNAGDKEKYLEAFKDKLMSSFRVYDVNEQYLRYWTFQVNQ